MDVAVDEVTIEDLSQDDVLNSDKDDVTVSNSDDELLTSDDDNVLSVDRDQDVVSSPESNQYSVNVDDITVFRGETFDVVINVDPCTDEDELYAYDFHFKIFNQDGEELFTENLFDDISTNRITKTLTSDNYGGAVGVYTIILINYEDDVLMDEATLTVVEPVIQNASVSVTQSGTYYKDKTLTVKVTDSDTNAVIESTKINLKFSNGKSVTLTTDSKGIVTYNVPYVPGTYTVQAICISKYVSGQSSKMTVKILKHKGTATLKQSGKYYGDKKITVKLVDSFTKKAVSGQYVKIKFSNGKTAIVKTNSKGVATYAMNFNPGKYSATAVVPSDTVQFIAKKLSNIKIAKTPVKFTTKNIKTTYDSGKYFNIKVINKATKKGIKGIKVQVKIKGDKTVTKTSGLGGKIKIPIAKLSLGSHKVTIKPVSKKLVTGKAKVNKIIIKKAGLKVNAPNSVNCYKQNDKYKVKVTNKVSGNGVKGIKVTMKVYTGKKFKTITVKTNSKGVASFNTKSLSKTSHKVVVSAKANKFYKSAKSQGSVRIIKAKLETSFELNYMNWNYYPNGALKSVSINLNLVDANGKILKKQITGQMKIQYYGSIEDYGPVATGMSGSTLEVFKNIGSWYTFVQVDFAGDSSYKPATYTRYVYGG